MQITSCLRLYDQSSTISILIDALLLNAKEMMAIGHPLKLILSSLIYLAIRFPLWAYIGLRFLRSLYPSITDHRDSRRVFDTCKYLFRISTTTKEDVGGHNT